MKLYKYTDKNKTTYRDRHEQVLKGWRLGTCGELCDLQINQPETVKNLPKGEYIWCENGACWLVRLDGNFYFCAGGEYVDGRSHLSLGAFLVRDDEVKR